MIEFDLASVAIGYVAGMFLCWTVCESWRIEK